MRAILSAPGSRGDVNPIVAIGRALKARGYDCVVSVAEPYANVVETAGLTANVVMDRQSFEQVTSKASSWRPFRGAKRILSEVANRFFHAHLDLIQAQYAEGQTALVAHPLDFASRVFREVTPSASLTSIHLAPASLRCPSQPPKLLPYRWLPTSKPIFNRFAYWAADHLFLDRILSPTINTARQRLDGKSRQTRFLNNWWISPDQFLGLFPSWFAPEIFEHYRNGHNGAAPLQCLGFPLDDCYPTNHSPGTSPGKIEVPTNGPILMTTGTAHHGDGDWVQRVAKACMALSIPMIWCSPTEANVGSGSEPDFYRKVGYIPLAQWLPHLRAIIHHGGIGTTSAAIHAGTPQMIRPMAFDQFDNADRVQRFGLGTTYRTDQDLSEQLGKLIDVVPQSPNSAATGLTASDLPTVAIQAAKLIDERCRGVHIKQS